MKRLGETMEFKKPQEDIEESKGDNVEMASKNEISKIEVPDRDSREIEPDNLESPSSDETIKANLEKLKKKMIEAESEDRQAELIEQKKFVESSGSVELNRMLAYARFQKDIILHVSPSKTLRLSEKLRFLDEGFRDLAKILNSDPKIKRVTGSSWIMRENPRLVERLGFTIEEISIGEKAFHHLFNLFRKEKLELHKNAYMSREDFLKRYLDKAI